MLEKLINLSHKEDGEQKKENKSEKANKEEEKKEDGGRRGSDKDKNCWPPEDPEFPQNLCTSSKTKLKSIAVKESEVFRKFFPDISPEFRPYQQKYNTEDYTWKIQGAAQMEENSPELANQITDLIDYIMKMTLGKYNLYIYLINFRFGEAKVDTEPLRQSVVRYIENIYGYEHLGFDYSQVSMIRVSKD